MLDSRGFRFLEMRTIDRSRDVAALNREKQTIHLLCTTIVTDALDFYTYSFEPTFPLNKKIPTRAST